MWILLAKSFPTVVLEFIVTLLVHRQIDFLSTYIVSPIQLYWGAISVKQRFHSGGAFGGAISA